MYSITIWVMNLFSGSSEQYKNKLVSHATALKKNIALHQENCSHGYTHMYTFTNWAWQWTLIMHVIKSKGNSAGNNQRQVFPRETSSLTYWCVLFIWYLTLNLQPGNSNTLCFPNSWFQRFSTQVLQPLREA